MQFGRMIGSLIGAFGGRALGGVLGGNTGRMIGSMAGSMLGSSGLDGVTKGLGSMFGGKRNQGQQSGGQPTANRLTGGVSNENPEQHAASTEAHAASKEVDEIDEVKAEVLLKAMCSAAKSDGTVDENEVQAILGRLGEVDAEESAMLRRELSGPVDLAGLLASVPQGFEAQVYAASLLAIDAVSGPEASYLKQLASGLGLSEEATTQIKDAIGV